MKPMNACLMVLFSLACSPRVFAVEYFHEKFNCEISATVEDVRQGPRTLPNKIYVNLDSTFMKDPEKLPAQAYESTVSVTGDGPVDVGYGKMLQEIFASTKVYYGGSDACDGLSPRYGVDFGELTNKQAVTLLDAMDLSIDPRTDAGPYPDYFQMATRAPKVQFTSRGYVRQKGMWLHKRSQECEDRYVDAAGTSGWYANTVKQQFHSPVGSKPFKATNGASVHFYVTCAEVGTHPMKPAPKPDPYEALRAQLKEMRQAADLIAKLNEDTRKYVRPNGRLPRTWGADPDSSPQPVK